VNAQVAGDGGANRLLPRHPLAARIHGHVGLQPCVPQDGLGLGLGVVEAHERLAQLVLLHESFGAARSERGLGFVVAVLRERQQLADAV